MLLNPYLVPLGVGICEWRDDIHIFPMFWLQTLRESEGADDIRQGARCDPPLWKRYPTAGLLVIVGAESQIPTLAALFSLGMPGF